MISFPRVTSLWSWKQTIPRVKCRPTRWKVFAKLLATSPGHCWTTSSRFYKFAHLLGSILCLSPAIFADPIPLIWLGVLNIPVEVAQFTSCNVEESRHWGTSRPVTTCHTASPLWPPSGHWEIESGPNRLPPQNCKIPWPQSVGHRLWCCELCPTTLTHNQAKNSIFEYIEVYCSIYLHCFALVCRKYLPFPCYVTLQVGNKNIRGTFAELDPLWPCRFHEISRHGGPRVVTNQGGVVRLVHSVKFHATWHWDSASKLHTHQGQLPKERDLMQWYAVNRKYVL